ncbi:MAG: helicase-associated domain-containing protein, partial [Micromonosporaceae bacterium]
MTLADHLRSLPDDVLAALLCARPELAVPVPGDVSALATRAQSRLSVARALEQLDLFTLEILDALRLLGGSSVTYDEVAALVPRGPVRAAVDTLRARALVYGTDDDLHVVPVVEECSSPYPANLGRPATALDPVAAQVADDPAALRQAVAAAPEPARKVLERLAAGPPIGTVSDTSRTDSAVGWLVSRHLLVKIDDSTVELPREVGLLLRADGPLGTPHPSPPALDPPRQDPAKADAAGAGQAMEAVRQVEALAETLTGEPVPLLRAGGIGVLPLRRLARATGIEEPLTALLLEVAYAAGLIDDDREAEPRWLPTGAYDAWRAGDLATRWARLAIGWLTMPRQPGLVGLRDTARDRPLTALSPDVERVGAPVLRRAALDCLAALPDGATPGPGEVIEWLAWQAPRRGGRHRDESVTWALAQAAALGITGLAALTSYGRLLVTGEPDDATTALGKLLPEPVDHVLVQADLTVVVPGPPEPALAAELSLAADAESGGGATVYRVTPGSVRRALDAGMSAEDVHQLFGRRSVTPVPQALTYLVDDTARRHGGLRVGSAGAYLRSDDATILAELYADKRLSHLALRRLAPTVLVTPYAPARLLTQLREHGYAPVPEDTTGGVVLTRPDVRRAPGRSRSPAPAEDLALDLT